MTIEHFVIGETTRKLESLPGKKFQVKVSLQGDIAVLPFYPEHCEGIAWLLMHQSEPGEVGREIPDELSGPRLLGEQPGIFIGAKDHKSLTVIIMALTELRNRLRDGPPKTTEEVLEDASQRAADDIAVMVDEEIVDGIWRELTDKKWYEDDEFLNKASEATKIPARYLKPPDEKCANVQAGAPIEGEGEVANLQDMTAKGTLPERWSEFAEKLDEQALNDIKWYMLDGATMLDCPACNESAFVPSDPMSEPSGHTHAVIERGFDPSESSFYLVCYGCGNLFARWNGQAWEGEGMLISSRRDGTGIPFDRHVDPKTDRMEMFDRAGNVMPATAGIPDPPEALEKLQEMTAKSTIPWGKITQ